MEAEDNVYLFLYACGCCSKGAKYTYIQVLTRV
jgi:hypothetical protein